MVADPAARTPATGSEATGRGVVEPSAVGHGVVEPSAVDPGVVERGAVERGAVERGAVERGAVGHGVVEPGAVEHGVVEHGAVELEVVVPGPPPPPLAGHLRMGEPGERPDAITVTSRYLVRDGRPWFPVTGEFHFSRYPAGEWGEELVKIRSGGITMVSTYVFWIMHEERRGVFDFAGDRDLRAFVTLCRDAGLDVVVRIGPWSHGECRNGGFPDWLLEAGVATRTDDPAYLALVRRFYAGIAGQLRGLGRADGGPVVAIQVENELYDQPEHLVTLKRLAVEVGLDAPLWTATGWGHARLPADEVIPLFGGYPEAAWDTAHDGWPQQSRAHYFFGPGRDDDSIGADLRATDPRAAGPGAGDLRATTPAAGDLRVTEPGATDPGAAGPGAGDLRVADPGADAAHGDRTPPGHAPSMVDSPGPEEPASGAGARLPAGELHLARSPFATCELGAGMYTAYHRRPVVAPADVAALSLVKLGSGSVWQGFYLYHGASMKLGELSTLQESHATGYPNDCPVVTYDFQAPLGEYGQFRPVYELLRMQHLWLAGAGAQLATMVLHLPTDAPRDTGDRQALRWAVRSDGTGGFLFVNNHQPAEPLPAHRGVRFAVTIAGRRLVVPRRAVDIPPGAYFVWPLARPVGPVTLLTASAQPVCELSVDGRPMVVLAQTCAIPVELVFDAATVRAVDGPAEVRREGGEVIVTGLRPGTGCRLRVSHPAGGGVDLLVLDERSARRAGRGRLWGRDRLVISASPAVVDGDRLAVYGAGPHADVLVYPPAAGSTAPAALVGAAGGGAGAGDPAGAGPGGPAGAVGDGAGRGDAVGDGVGDGVGPGGAPGEGVTGGLFSRHPVPGPGAASLPAEVRLVRPAGRAPRPVVDPASGRASAPTDPALAGAAAIVDVRVPAEAFEGGAEVLLRVDWTGDVARAELAGRLVADQFWDGRPWEIGLRRWRDEVLAHGLRLYLLPLDPAAPVFLAPAARPAAGPDGQVFELRSVTVVPVPRTIVPGPVPG